MAEQKLDGTEVPCSPACIAPLIPRPSHDERRPQRDFELTEILDDGHVNMIG